MRSRNAKDICDRPYIFSSSRTKLSTCRYKSVHWIQSKDYTPRRQLYVFNAAPRPGFCPASVWRYAFPCHTICEPYCILCIDKAFTKWARKASTDGKFELISNNRKFFNAALCYWFYPASAWMVWFASPCKLWALFLLATFSFNRASTKRLRQGPF
jgi:hypothetical protein